MDFEYITQLVPGNGCRIDEFETAFKGCDCVGTSCMASNGCSCLLYKKDIFLNGISLIETSLELPILECSDECACALNDKRCNNRCVQLGVTLPLEVFVTARKGMGLRCRDRIAKGRFVIEYIGEVIGAEEVMKRISPINYVLTVNEFFVNESEKAPSSLSSSSSSSSDEDEKRKRWRTNATFIDPTKRGNLARFINHSCDPNLRLIPVRIGTPLVHIGLFACRTIEPLEELTYDYGKGESNVNLIQLPCHCESDNCRRFLPTSATATSSSNWE